MDQVIMPELITPTFAEIIAENPEILKIIVDNQPNEEVIVGQNCTIDSGCNSTNVKLVLCNVTIGVSKTTDECDRGCCTENAEEQTGGCHISVCGGDQNQWNKRRKDQQWEQGQLELEIAVLEARMDEIERILKLIPRQIFNRKLVARCKRNLIETGEQLAAKKKELEYKVWFMQSGE